MNRINVDEKSNDDLDSNVEKINGPVNVVRLEGNVHGITKVIYLFMDQHNFVTHQTQCTNVYSEDISKYFSKNFRELNTATKKYDFFLEIWPTKIFYGLNYKTFRDRYIDEVAKLFAKIFSYDKEKNKVNISDQFQNVRLHYLDIRDYLEQDVYNLFLEAFNVIISYWRNGLHGQLFGHTVDLLYRGKKQIDFLIEILENPSIKISKKIPVIQEINNNVMEPETIAYLVHKIKNVYKHNDVSNKINGILNELINDFKNFSKYIKTSIDHILFYDDLIINSFTKFQRDPNYDKKIDIVGISPYKERMIMAEITNTCQKIDRDAVRLFSQLTDIYFLRRFLDKDYITNAIVYTGANHSDNYIRILITHFDFKITHVSYSPIGEIRALNEEIKMRLKNGDNLSDLFIPVTAYQCSDMTDFPKNFA